MKLPDKLCVYVPDSMVLALDRDARLFEVFRKGAMDINRNKFLSLVLLGHYDRFVTERRQIAEAVALDLEGEVPDAARRRDIARRIADNLSSPVPPTQRVRGARRITIKPTRMTEGVLREALASLGGEDRVSRFFYGLLASYCAKASYERELIVYKAIADELRAACQAREIVSFVTTQNPGTIHRVVPYKLTEGLDGLLNYLLCYEEAAPERPAAAFRLSRISALRRTGELGSIPKDAMRHLSQMGRLGPQYAINEDVEACVRLTDRGLDTYRRIYLGRPDHTRLERIGSDWLCRFECSPDQLFLYFRRFGVDEAEVLAPESLRNRLIEFHAGALRMYGR